MAVVRKKQDDKYLKELRELVTSGGGNRQCFDCGQKGPTYVNMTIGSFVCTRCSGVLRGLTPPHRVKSISMATFTQDEIDFLKAHGNDLCAKTWLGLWDPKRAVHQDHRELMIDKYERKRYYLEPASPLKSLTNATSLKSNATSASVTASASASTQNGNTNHSGSNGNSHIVNGYGSSNGNGNNNNTNNHKQNSIDNNIQSIQLTPPTSQRTAVNGLHKSAGTSAISRPQQQQNGFNHHHHHQQDAFMVNNGLNGLAKANGLNTSVGSASTGALSDTSSCASNGFGPDADFVADFGSANIFDATSAGSVGSPAVSSASSVASSNGYAKIQPIKTAHQIMNGNANSKLQQNGTSLPTTTTNGNTENFADFDHAPIYNAAGLPIPNGKSSASANSYHSNNNKLSSTPSEDRYAALKDLDEQLRESKAVAAAAASIVASTVVDSFGNPPNNNNGNVVNPFKSQQHAAASSVNPFQGTQNTQTQNLFGQMTVIPNGMTANGFASPSQQQHQQPQPQQQHQAFFNYSNGFAAASTGVFPPTLMAATTTTTAGGPNGCGFGFGTMQQQIAATGGGMAGGAFNNPFAATGALNSNNPFL